MVQLKVSFDFTKMPSPQRCYGEPSPSQRRAFAVSINFMIVHPSAIMQVMKHRLVRVFSPEQNLEADAYRLNFRFYHDTFVKANKVKGIYVQTAA